MLMPWRQMEGKQHRWFVTGIYFCLVAFCVIDIKVIQYNEWWMCSASKGNPVASTILLYRVIVLSCHRNEIHADHRRTCSLCSHHCSDCKIIVDFCVWSQMVSLITTEVHLVFSRLCLDIIEKWSCVFLFSERRYYTKDLLL